ncbi:hypothetical protein DOK_00632 [gamma proteobacterium BDW918]|uniref:DUF4136 domain-containing protein n=2 Tax=Zhongshania aliphaticivorans TaxID=1470434 RepID=A0A127M2X2_9GAMM|nr:DUF4136 domain-containing protein [Zhongshania aliphaticivorans]AMO67570.1 hypothetical protein AZF00_04335 [Zhongshania aliphaticivorans]EIF45022.1 hypothetical protein DOK_00632 [gamma proteobacterium BDW918]
MKTSKLFILIVAMLLSACSTTNVVSDYNPNIDFSRYQHYLWSESSGADKNISPFIIDNVKAALQTQLSNRAYLKAPAPQAADFIVKYYLAEAADTIDRSPRLGLGIGSFGGNFGMSSSVGVPLGKDTVNRNVQIIIDFINPADMKLSWRGSLVVELHNSDPKANTAMIEEAVAEILNQFPPSKQ